MTSDQSFSISPSLRASLRTRVTSAAASAFRLDAERPSRHPPPTTHAQVSKVCAGGSHTVFLTTDGEVWTCGRGEYGLCGNGGTEDQLTPSPLEAFEESIIVDVQVL